MPAGVTASNIRNNIFIIFTPTIGPYRNNNKCQTFFSPKKKYATIISRLFECQTYKRQFLRSEKCFLCSDVFVHRFTS